ncbi:unnamed protein product [Closterium sp. NIES-53]
MSLLACRSCTPLDFIIESTGFSSSRDSSSGRFSSGAYSSSGFRTSRGALSSTSAHSSCGALISRGGLPCDCCCVALLHAGLRRVSVLLPRPHHCHTSFGSSPCYLADSTSGPTVARSSTTLPCPAVPSGFLTGLYIPSFSQNLVGVEYLQDGGITITFLAHGRTAICTDSSTGAVLATFTREPHSCLFDLHTPPPQVAASGQVASSPPVAEPDQGPAPSGVSQVDPPPLVEHFEISFDSSGRAEGGDLAADDTAATCRSPRLETPPVFPPRPSLPPPQPVAVKSGAETAGAEPWGAETEGEGSGGAATGGAGSGGAATGGAAIRGAGSGGAATRGAATSSGGGAVGDPAGAIRAWIVRQGSPGGGGYGPAGTGATSPGGATGAGGAGGAAGGAGGAASAGGTSAAAGARGTRAASPGGAGGATRAGGAGATSPRGATGAGGAGAASPEGPAGAGGAGAAGTGGAGAAGTGGAGAAGTGGAGATGAGGAGGAAGAGGARAGGTGAASPGGAHTGGVGAAGAGGGAGAGGAGGTGAAGAAGPGGARTRGAGAVEADGAAGTAPRRPFFYPQPQSSLPPPGSVLRQVLSLSSSTGLTPPLLCPAADQSQPQLLPGSPLPSLAPHTEVTESLTERQEPENRASTPVRARRVACPPAVPGTHGMARRPSFVPQRVVLPEPPASSLLHVPNLEFDIAHAASPTVTRLLATVVTDLDFESIAAFSLVTELVDFAARSRLNYVASLVTESKPVCPSSVGGEPAISSDVLQDRQFELECLAAALPRFASMLLCHEGDPDALDIPTPRSYAEAIVGEYSSQWHTAMDVEMASWKSTGTYVDEVPPPGANIVDGMWIFRGVDFFQTFSPTPKMTTLRVLLHVAAQRDYELHSLDFSTAFLQGSLHEDIWLRRPHSFTGSFFCGYPVEPPAASLRSPPGASRVARHTEDDNCGSWVLQRFGFQFSSPQPTPLSIGHSLSAPPPNESVEPSGSYPELVGCLMYLMTTSGMGLVLGGWGSVILTGHSDASSADDQVTQRSSHGYTFSLGSSSVSWRSTHSSSVLGSSSEVEIYAGAMAAEELRWLTNLQTDLGERPRSPPVLYVDNKAMLALCREQRLEHRTKHIAFCYFLARELQQRPQLCLSYLASRANTADVFTKALRSADHQRFCNALGLVPTLPHLLVA